MKGSDKLLMINLEQLFDYQLRIAGKKEHELIWICYEAISKARDYINEERKRALSGLQNPTEAKTP